MKKQLRTPSWAKLVKRQVGTTTRLALAPGARSLAWRLHASLRKPGPPSGAGAWLPGLALGTSGARRFRLYQPPGVKAGERLPLLVMLHGCKQDANAFASSTRMNRVAQRERFLVLYPEQDHLANAQGCWNWFETDRGRAYKEAESIMLCIDQVCAMHPVDASRLAIVGLSAGASMAALIATGHPHRFKAVVMHSGIAPGSAHSALSALRAMRGQGTTAASAAPPGVALAPWPALLVIHGNADRVVSPLNGHAAAMAWAQAADASAGATRRVQRGQRHPMAITDFKHQGRLVATLVQCAALFCTYPAAVARAALARVTLARMSLALAVQMNGLGSML